MNVHREKFERIVQGMQVPQVRRHGTAENARWFLRKGVAGNRDHADILLAIYHARHLAE